jgi:hypothetical protein
VGERIAGLEERVLAWERNTAAFEIELVRLSGVVESHRAASAENCYISINSGSISRNHSERMNSRTANQRRNSRQKCVRTSAAITNFIRSN